MVDPGLFLQAGVIHTWIEMVFIGLITGCSCSQVGGTYLDRDGFDRVGPGLFLQAGRSTYLDGDGFDRVDPWLFLQAGLGVHTWIEMVLTGLIQGFSCRLVGVHTWIEMVLTGLIQGCSCRLVVGTYLDRDGFDRVDPRLFQQTGSGYIPG